MGPTYGAGGLQLIERASHCAVCGLCGFEGVSNCSGEGIIAGRNCDGWGERLKRV